VELPWTVPAARIPAHADNTLPDFPGIWASVIVPPYRFQAALSESMRPHMKKNGDSKDRIGAVL